MADKKRYTVKVVETCRLWGVVEVEAESQEEAQQLAEEDFVPSWDDSDIEERFSLVLTENGVPVEFSPEAFDIDPANPYGKKTDPEVATEKPEAEKAKESDHDPEIRR